MCLIFTKLLSFFPGCNYIWKTKKTFLPFQLFLSTSLPPIFVCPISLNHLFFAYSFPVYLSLLTVPCLQSSGLSLFYLPTSSLSSRPGLRYNVYIHAPPVQSSPASHCVSYSSLASAGDGLTVDLGRK